MTESQEKTSNTQTLRRPVSRREAVEAFKRLKLYRSSSESVSSKNRDSQQSGFENLPEKIQRFSFGTRLEHLVLILSVTVLAVTGLAQTFDNTSIGRSILLFSGGLEIAQQYHHVFGLILVALAIYHIWDAVDARFVRLQTSRIKLESSDFQHFSQTIKLLFGFSKKLPLFDRYSFYEKFVYWVTAGCVAILSITGLIMRYPTIVTSVLPGSIYPFAVIFHRWPAIYLVIVILLFHTYQILPSRGNFSMFTGNMSVEKMKAEHPAELAYLVKAASLVSAKTWPQTVEAEVEERLARSYAEVYAELLEDTIEIDVYDDTVQPADVEITGATETNALVDGSTVLITPETPATELEVNDQVVLEPALIVVTEQARSDDVIEAQRSSETAEPMPVKEIEIIPPSNEENS